MLDERGREIDLDVVDAVGQLPDGRYEFWLKDESRVISGDPTAFDKWIEHVRAKHPDEATNTVLEKPSTREKYMLTGNTGQTDPALNKILESLSISDEPYNQLYRTSSQEDYRRLVQEALNGRLDGVVSVGRSGIYLNELLIAPPSNT
jgi:hypothetical protein